MAGALRALGRARVAVVLSSVVAASASARGPDVSAIQRWLAAAHRSPSLRQRLSTIYTAVLVLAIGGVVVYGTASSALAQVVSADAVARWGPSLMLLALLGAAHWGTVQGPVVFSMADVAHLLGAPLPRAPLVARPLRRAFAFGFSGGVLVAVVLLVGLTGDHRHVTVARMVGVAGGLGLLGVIAVALAWMVSSSGRVETALRRFSWPVVALAGGLAIVAGVGGSVGRTVALWSGPWGWAVQAGAGVSSAQWLFALAGLVFFAFVAVAFAWRRRGLGESERFARRAEGRTQLEASLMSFDARTSRRALASVALRAGVSGRGGGLRRLRRRLSLVDVRWLGGRRAGELAVVWRDALVLTELPQRVVQSAALAAGGAAFVLVDVGRSAGVIVGAVLIYAGAARLLEPMRIELDAPSRGSVFLGIRAGRALMAHMLVPSVVVCACVAVCAVGLVVAGVVAGGGVLAGGEPAAALALVCVSPAVVCCAGMSARRRGQLPQELLATAIVSDPSGGGLVLLGWLLLWPAVAAAVVLVPIKAVALGVRPGAVAAVVAVAVAATAVAVAMLAQRRDPAED